MKCDQVIVFGNVVPENRGYESKSTKFQTTFIYATYDPIVDAGLGNSVFTLIIKLRVVFCNAIRF